MEHKTKLERVIEELRKAGARVEVCDGKVGLLLAGYQGVNYLILVKPSWGLTHIQKERLESWPGLLQVVDKVEEAVGLLGGTRW